MDGIPDGLCQWERDLQQHLLALYDAGDFLSLCNQYCHEKWGVYRRDNGEMIDAGICSFTVSGCSEDAALRWVATHIRLQVLQGVLGC